MKANVWKGSKRIPKEFAFQPLTLGKKRDNCVLLTAVFANKRGGAVQLCLRSICSFKHFLEQNLAEQ